MNTAVTEMKIGLLDKAFLILRIYAKLYKMPIRFAIKTLFKPVESTRYTEFCYLLRFLKKKPLAKNSKILDVSSPYAMAYLLNNQGNEISKTDINEKESETIKESQNLKFLKEDGTKLSFKDNTFDLTYSISVIEHIFNLYLEAVSEMIRVTKHGGYIYISTPLSKEHVEEWVEKDIYSDQYKENDKVFFQYRFSLEDIQNIMKSVENADVISSSIYWERKDGDYNKFIANLENEKFGEKLGFLRNSYYNMFIGSKILSKIPSNKLEQKSFGNISFILRKK